jgi:hypothetical protein
MLKNASLAKKSWQRDFAATVETPAKIPSPKAILDANPYTEHTKKHLIPARIL